jgi:hypothetical protein
LSGSLPCTINIGKSDPKTTRNIPRELLDKFSLTGEVCLTGEVWSTGDSVSTGEV